MRLVAWKSLNGSCGKVLAEESWRKYCDAEVLELEMRRGRVVACCGVGVAK